jgi:hypothetical protein
MLANVLPSRFGEGSNLPQTRHRQNLTNSDNGGFLRVTEESVFVANYEDNRCYEKQYDSNLLKLNGVPERI